MDNFDFDFDFDLGDISFELIDEKTVERLERDGSVVLPKRKIDVPKDQRWNSKQLGSSLLQGINNGDSITKIAERMLDIVGGNEASSIRNARTMFTSAENHGRLDSYLDLEDQGVIQHKVWEATGDSRTRRSHQDMDGEEVDVKEEFSNGLMYPGDGEGEPAEVWNCRCTMKDEIIGFRKSDGRIVYV